MQLPTDEKKCCLNKIKIKRKTKYTEKCIRKPQNVMKYADRSAAAAAAISIVCAFYTIIQKNVLQFS